uniref:Uncharacterized protein n=1 Tax=Marseillevirus LCMAC103 TaxID=2506604 RepID=A0A481YX05_9VIRU|nr:MAG: hypothetical protein LCMAC103_04000 [Marseillevirus LCMAC103]
MPVRLRENEAYNVRSKKAERFDPSRVRIVSFSVKGRTHYRLAGPGAVTGDKLTKFISKDTAHHLHLKLGKKVVRKRKSSSKKKTSSKRKRSPSKRRRSKKKH